MNALGNVCKVNYFQGRFSILYNKAILVIIIINEFSTFEVEPILDLRVLEGRINLPCQV